LGSRIGNWLTRDQARLLLEKADGEDLRSLRDLAMIVRRRAERMKLDHLAPHHLRWTCSELCHVNAGELEQIQFLFGHVSVLTTERYLGCKQNLEEPVNHRFGCLFASKLVDLR
jgi:site-specific recombinase XerD